MGPDQFKQQGAQAEESCEQTEALKKENYALKALLAEQGNEIKKLKAELEQQKSVDKLYSKRLEKMSDRILNLENKIEVALYAQELKYLQDGLEEAQGQRDMSNALLGTHASAVQSRRIIHLPLTTKPENRPTGRTNPDHPTSTPEEVGIC